MNDDESADELVVERELKLPSTLRHVTKMKMRLIDIGANPADIIHHDADDHEELIQIPFVPLVEPPHNAELTKHVQEREAGKTNPNSVASLFIDNKPGTNTFSGFVRAVRSADLIASMDRKILATIAAAEGANAAQTPTQAGGTRPVIPELKLPGKLNNTIGNSASRSRLGVSAGSGTGSRGGVGAGLGRSESVSSLRRSKPTLPVMPNTVVKKVGDSKTTLKTVKRHYAYPFNTSDDLRDAYEASDSKLYRIQLRKSPRLHNTQRSDDFDEEHQTSSNSVQQAPTAFMSKMFAAKRLDPWYDEDSDNEYERAQKEFDAARDGDGELEAGSPIAIKRDKASYLDVAFGATKSGAETTLHERYATAERDVMGREAILLRFGLEQVGKLLGDFTVKFPFRQLWGLDLTDDMRASTEVDSSRALLSRDTIRTVRGRTARERARCMGSGAGLAPDNTQSCTALDSSRAMHHMGPASARQRAAETNFERSAVDLQAAQAIVQSENAARVCLLLAKLMYYHVLKPRYAHSRVLLEGDQLPDMHSSQEPEDPEIPRIRNQILREFCTLDMRISEQKRAGYAKTRPVLLLAIRTVVEAALREIFPHHFLLEAAIAAYLRKYVPRADLVEIVRVFGSAGRMPKSTSSMNEGASSDDGVKKDFFTTIFKRGSIVDSKVTCTTLVAFLLTWTPTHSLLDSMIANLVDPARYGSHVASLESQADAQKHIRKARHNLRRCELVGKLVKSAANIGLGAARTGKDTDMIGSRCRTAIAATASYNEAMSPSACSPSRLKWGRSDATQVFSLSRLAGSLSALMESHSVGSATHVSVDISLTESLYDRPTVCDHPADCANVLPGAAVAVVPHSPHMREKMHAVSGGVNTALAASMSAPTRKFLSLGPKKAPAITEAALRPALATAGMVLREPNSNARLRPFTPRTEVMRSASAAQFAVAAERSHAIPTEVGGADTADLTRFMMQKIAHRYDKLDKARNSRDMQHVLKYLRDGAEVAPAAKTGSTLEPKSPLISLVALEQKERDAQTEKEHRAIVQQAARRKDISEFCNRLHARLSLKPSALAFHKQHASEVDAQGSHDLSGKGSHAEPAVLDDQSKAALRATKHVTLQLPATNLTRKRGKAPEPIFAPIPLDLKPLRTLTPPAQPKPVFIIDTVSTGPQAFGELSRDALGLPPEPEWLTKLRIPASQKS